MMNYHSNSILINGYFTRYQQNENDDVELVFTIKGYRSKEIAKTIPKNEALNVKLTKTNINRSNEQNALMWELIDQIAKKTGNTAESVYEAILVKAESKYIDLSGIAEIENELKKSFRAVRKMGMFINENNVPMYNYRCYIGSSKFNKSEMTQLLETTIDLAAEYEIFVKEIEV